MAERRRGICGIDTQESERKAATAGAERESARFEKKGEGCSSEVIKVCLLGKSDNSLPIYVYYIWILR